MRDAASRRDFSALEQRRLRGARLLGDGVKQAEVARRLGVHRQSVSRWAKQLKRGGERGLRAGRLGRPTRLHGEDLRRLEGQLKRGPEARGHSRWTVALVGELIERVCRVKYDRSQAWRVLKGLGWSFHPGGRRAGATGTPGWRRGH